MTDHYITDAKHAVKIAENGIVAIEQLTKLWMREDDFACAPGSTGESPTSGGGMSDPTHLTATREADRYRSRDAVGRKLMSVVAELEAAVKVRQPRKAGGPCRCCETETATHGEDKDGDPAECWGCWRFRKEHGFHCGSDVHEGRPRKDFCRCPPECCDPCPDPPADNRTTTGLSDRCAQRKVRGKWHNAA